jgi:hypothetical protein
MCGWPRSLSFALACALLAAVGGALLATGCGTLSAPPAETTLAAGGAAELDARTREAIAAVEKAPQDLDALLAAAQYLLFAADLRVQRATVDWLRAHAQATRAEVLAAGDQVPDDVRAAVVSLCTRGLEFADRAAGLAPKDVRARMHQALHVSLLAWANGPARSLFAGYGPKLVKAIDAAVALDPAHDGASPLRLSGRFRGEAPWPYGDLAAAETSLARAVELAPCLLNELFYGDVLARRDRVDAAAAQWRAALAAPADESTRWSGELLREEARARLAATH